MNNPPPHHPHQPNHLIPRDNPNPEVNSHGNPGANAYVEVYHRPKAKTTHHADGTVTIHLPSGEDINYTPVPSSIDGFDYNYKYRKADTLLIVSPFIFLACVVAGILLTSWCFRPNGEGRYGVIKRGRRERRTRTGLVAWWGDN